CPAVDQGIVDPVARTSAARGGGGRCPTIKAGRPLEQTLPPPLGRALNRWESSVGAEMVLPPPGGSPFRYGRLPRQRRRCVGVTNKFEGLARSDLPPLERVAYTVPEFCFRNNISRPTYHRLRAEGRGPVEMRLGLNAIRISAEAERNWQLEMQKPRPD